MNTHVHPAVCFSLFDFSLFIHSCGKNRCTHAYEYVYMYIHIHIHACHVAYMCACIARERERAGSLELTSDIQELICKLVRFRLDV